VNQYLYAIVDRLPARWRPPTAGIAGAAVVPRRVDDVVVLSSVLESVPAANPRTLALHQDVVATVIEAPATLPFRYGTAVPAAEFPAWLDQHRSTVTGALAAVRGCVEMNVKLLRLDCSIAHQLAGGAGAPRGGVAPGEPIGRELQALADTLVERAGLPQWRYRPSGSAGNIAAVVAFLVPRPDLAGFLARIAPVASHAPGVAVVPTGPWAPYSFAPDLGRPSLVRMPTEPFDGARRLAG
jgi:hypothetical protein